MKETILEKLWNDKELSNEEVVFISKNLQEGEVLAFAHDMENVTPFVQCGLEKADIDKANEKFTSIIKSTQSISHLVEELEILVLGNEKMLRLMLLQSIKHALENRGGARVETHVIKGDSAEALAEILKRLFEKGGKTDDLSD